MHTAIERPVEYVAERLKVGGPKCHSQLKAQTDLCTQSGGGIDSSIVSTCLENLEDLDKKGVDMEVICNTAGITYAGRSRFTCTATCNATLLTTSYRDVRYRACRHRFCEASPVLIPF